MSFVYQCIDDYSCWKSLDRMSTYSWRAVISFLFSFHWKKWMKHKAQCFRKQDVNRIYNPIRINRSESVGVLRCFQGWFIRNCIPVICYLHTREHELTHKIKQPTIWRIYAFRLHMHVCLCYLVTENWAHDVDDDVSPRSHASSVFIPSVDLFAFQSQRE